MQPTTLVLSLLATFLNVVLSSQNGANPVKLSVYYEARCPDSQRFVVQQMYPVWSDLKDIMLMDINAYGKVSDTSSGDGYTFKCQHGPLECEANMMLTCAKHNMTEDKYLAFTNCIMEASSGTTAGPYCAKKIGEDYAPVRDCWHSTKGQILLHEVGEIQRTLDPALDYVPWILINDNYSDAQLNAAQENLRKVICDAYQGDKPEQCNQEL